MATSATGNRKVLISYAHENDRHRDTVARFAELLAAAGIDIVIDRMAAGERQDWASWTIERIREADRVLVVVSRGYRERFEGTGPPDVGRGVQFEGLIISDEIYGDHRTGLRKFIPVLLPDARREDIPTVLLRNAGTHYKVSELSDAGVAAIVDLLRRPLTTVQNRADVSMSAGSVGTTSCAALHLLVSGGTPGGADDVVRGLLDAGAGGTALFSADTRQVGAYLAGPLEIVVRALGEATRVVRARVREQRSNAGPPIWAELGAHVADSPDEAREIAERLARSDAARRMHAVRDGGFVLAVSPEFHDELRRAPEAHPPADSFRECPDAGANGDSCWVAVPGRLHAPALPGAPPPNLLPPVDSAVTEQPSTSPLFVTGSVEGSVTQVAGNATISIVQNFGRQR